MQKKPAAKAGLPLPAPREKLNLIRTPGRKKSLKPLIFSIFLSSFNSSSESEDPRSCHLILPSLFHRPSDWDPSPCSSHLQSKDRTCRRAFHNREAPCMHTVVAFRPSLLGKDSLPEAVTLLGVVSSDRTDSMREDIIKSLQELSLTPGQILLGLSPDLPWI